MIIVHMDLISFNPMQQVFLLSSIQRQEDESFARLRHLPKINIWGVRGAKTQAQEVSLQSPCSQLPCLCFLFFFKSFLLLDLCTHWSYYFKFIYFLFYYLLLWTSFDYCLYHQCFCYLQPYYLLLGLLQYPLHWCQSLQALPHLGHTTKFFFGKCGFNCALLLLKKPQWLLIAY